MVLVSCGVEADPPPDVKKIDEIPDLPAVCGNGTLEKGEGCDDGNREDNDGCSSFCMPEGSCDLPVELVVQNDRAGFEGQLVPTLVGLEAECGNAGSEVAFQVIVPTAGRLSWKVETPVPAVTYVSTTCGGTSDVVDVCVPASETTSVRFSRANLAFLVVDFEEEHASAIDVSLDVDFFPDAGLNQPCDEHEGASCAQGLTCYDVGTPGRCAAAEAPILAAVEASRVGDALQLRVLGSDANGDTYLVVVRALDEAGATLSNGRANVTPEGLLGQTDIDLTFQIEGFFAAVPQAASVRVQLWDAAGIRSSNRNASFDR
jgi:cysteine-rich repeat protein